MSYYTSTILADSPAGYYRLDEASGTSAADSTTNGYNGTINGTMTFSQVGALTSDADTAYLLDGTSAWINVAASGVRSGGLSAYSVEAWVKPTSTSTNQALIGDSFDTSTNGFTLRAYFGQFKFYVGNGTSFVAPVAPGAFSLNTWYHVVGTYNATTASLYVNGVLVATASMSGAIGSSGNAVQIGAYSSGNYFPGTLDEVAIYTTALSAGQVSSHYNAGIRPATTLTGVITNAGINLLRDGGSGANNPKITYVALGTSSTAPTAGDTKLGAESFRKAVTSFTNGTQIGELLVNMYLSPTDDVGDNIQEVGFFGGSSATSAPNTGVLVAHGLYNHNPKLNTESIQFTLDMTL